MRLPNEIARLLEVAGSHPEGGAALLDGHLESVSALYQLHPATVEEVRSSVARPGMRERAEEIFAAVREVRTPTPESHSPVADAGTLIARASQTPQGLEFLKRAPIENAAVLLGTHAFIVEQARQQLAAQSSNLGHP